MITFKEIAPFVITATLITCALIATKIKKENILTIDGLFAMAGFTLGLFITTLNLIYSHNLISALGPLLSITCLLYLRFRYKILKTTYVDFNIILHPKISKLINILYWIVISIALISFHQAPPYYRPSIFFFSISIGVALLGLEILSSKFKNDISIFYSISKILLISIILRASAYFVSPYPIGSDPWGHAEYIKSFLHLSHILLRSYPGIELSECYCNYPLSHLVECSLNLIGDISVQKSMFILGTLLALSTIFVYLIGKEITKSVNLSLLFMLLLNFSDFHIKFSIEVIAMTFGLILYTIIIYLLLKKNKNNKLVYASFLILFVFLITWTHTVSAFITLISIISLYIGSFFYYAIYRGGKYKEPLVSLTFCIILAVVIAHHWIDPSYPFYESVIRGLYDSLRNEAEFLSSVTLSKSARGLDAIIEIIGFLFFVFFGVIGSLYSLSRKIVDKTKLSFIFMFIVLYFITFVFPIMGLENILPLRWMPFLYVSFILFVSLGLIVSIGLIKNNRFQRVVFVLIILFITSFFMTTNLQTNRDSPVYLEEVKQKLVWTESEMTLYKSLRSYNGEIVTDVITCVRPFETFLKRDNTSCYLLTDKGDIDWDHLNNKLAIFRKISLTRPVTFGIKERWRGINMLFKADFKKHLDDNFGCIYDTGEARAYI